MVDIDGQLAGLSEMPPARLRAEWRRLHRGLALLEDMTPSQMKRAIAWRLQEKLHGGLPPARLRELDRLSLQLKTDGEIDIGEGPSLKPGSRLVRHWHGRAYCVTVLEDGFEFEERHYSSLTQIACEITGVHWSGPRFFGLKRRKGDAS